METRRHGEELRREIGKKNDRKIKWLEDKYGMGPELIDDLSEEEREKYGCAEVFDKKTKMRGVELREPEVVKSVNEVLDLTEDEKRVLALGPKFCVRKLRLNEEEFKVDLEECIAKIKWGKMGEEQKKGEKKDLADVAIMAILEEEEKEEILESEEMKEAKRRMVFDDEGKKWNYGRKRVTD